MKKKRKYTRKVVTTPEESKSSHTKEESSIIPQVVDIPATVSEFSFNDLPLSRRVGVEYTIKMRKRLKLPDDSKERRELAVKMFRGDRPR